MGDNVTRFILKIGKQNFWQRWALLFLLSMVIANPVAYAKKTVSALTFNLLYDSVHSKQSMNLIKKLSSDIVCLTELTPVFSRKFTKKFSRLYQYRAFYAKRGTWGIGIASRYPIVKSKIFPIKPHRIPGVEAVIKIGKHQLLVSCVHLFPPGAKRKKSDSLWASIKKNTQLRVYQVKYLQRKYRYWKKSILLLGDMNESRSGRAMKFLLKSGYQHACQMASKSQCGATYPGATSRLPAVIEIDHILGRKLEFVSARVVKGGGSDHYPVTAKFIIR